MGVRRIGGTCVLVTMVVMLAGPAVAEGEIGVSRDGRTWSSSLTGDLFDASLRWNPGMTRTTSVYVRNQAAERGDLSITAQGPTTSELERSGDLHLAARVGDGRWFDIGRPGSVRLTQVPVPAGRTARLDVRTTFDARSTNQTQNMRLRLRFDVVAQQDTSSTSMTLPGGRARGGGSAGVGLPDTGAPATPVLAVAAIGSLLVGALTLRGGVRRG